MTNKTELRKKFDELPDKIREWLTSERATSLIIDINERLSMIGPLTKIIPNTILRLVVHDLDPNEFINILANELDLDFNSAKNIAQEIEEKILRPIEAPLRREADIDIKLIYFASPVIAQPTPPTQTPIAVRVEPPKVVEPPVRQIPTPPASPAQLGGPQFPQSRPTFQPIRPPIVRLPINVPKGNENLESSS